MGNGVFDLYDFVQVFGVEHFSVNIVALFSTESKSSLNFALYGTKIDFLLQNCFAHIITFLSWSSLFLIFNHIGALSTYRDICMRARICKRLCSLGIDYKESIPSAYVAWQAGTTNRVAIPARQAKLAGGIDSLESIPGLLKSLQIWALWWDKLTSVADKIMNPNMIEPFPGFLSLYSFSGFSIFLDKAEVNVRTLQNELGKQ